MTDQPKVVHMMNSTNQTFKKLPPAVKSVYEKLTTLLKSDLDLMLDMADDRFYRLSDDTSKHGTYMNAMKLLSSHRQQLIQSFDTKIKVCFSEIINEKMPKSEKKKKTESGFSLSLVDDNGFDEKMAEEMMASKATSQNKTSLSHLNQRLAAALNIESIGDNQNPASPFNLCTFFCDCVKEIDLIPEIRLEIFKIFEKEVLSKLSEVYHELNTQLGNAGVLPKLGSYVESIGPNKSSSTRSPSKGIGEYKPLPESSMHKFNEMEEILNAALSVRGPAVADADYKGPTQPQKAINNLITKVSQSPALPGDELNEWNTFNLKEIIERQVIESSPGKTLPISRQHHNALNLITMMFDKILDDSAITPNMRAVIARLQLPFVKIALSEQEIFDEQNHPARALLNQMASVCLGFNDGQDKYQTKLEDFIIKTVSKITSLEEPTTIQVNQLLIEFESFLAEQQNEIQPITEKLCDQETLKAEHKIATQVASDTINDHFKNLDDDKQDLPTRLWQAIIYGITMKYGKDCEEVDRARVTSQQLSWLINKEPELIDRIFYLKVGCQVISDFKRCIHYSSLSAKENILALRKLTQLINNRLSKLTQQTTSDTQSNSADVLFASLIDSSDVTENFDNEETTEDLILSEYYKQIETFGFGTLFKLRHSDGTTKKCKLAMASKTLDIYLLVTFSGIKIQEFSCQEFATSLSEGTIELVENTAVFDKALNSVIQGLRRTA